MGEGGGGAGRGGWSVGVMADRGPEGSLGVFRLGRAEKQSKPPRRREGWIAWAWARPEEVKGIVLRTDNSYVAREQARIAPPNTEHVSRARNKEVLQTGERPQSHRPPKIGGRENFAVALASLAESVMEGRRFLHRLLGLLANLLR